MGQVEEAKPSDIEEAEPPEKHSQAGAWERGILVIRGMIRTSYWLGYS
jgi:hypothetical protein